MPVGLREGHPVYGAVQLAVAGPGEPISGMLDDHTDNGAVPV